MEWQGFELHTSYFIFFESPESFWKETKKIVCVGEYMD